MDFVGARRDDARAAADKILRVNSTAPGPGLWHLRFAGDFSQAGEIGPDHALLLCRMPRPLRAGGCTHVKSLEGRGASAPKRQGDTGWERSLKLCRNR